jgi:Ni,Fe-hydrogenase I small subunit
MKMPRQAEAKRCPRERYIDRESEQHKHPLIWLETNSCGGDTLSLLNSTNHDYQEMIIDLVDLVYNTQAMSAEGYMANKNRNQEWLLHV